MFKGEIQRALFLFLGIPAKTSKGPLFQLGLLSN